MESTTLITRLENLRTTVRRRLAAYGLCAVFSGGVLSFLTVVALDWFLWLPPALRLLGGLLFAAGFVGAVYHWVVAPLRAPMGIDVVAERLERHFPDMRDQLLSTINFVQRRDAGSESMMRRVVAQTESLLRGLPLESALSVRPLAIRATWLAAALIALGTIAALAPGWVRTGIVRYANPLGDTEWPRTVAINALSFDQTVAIGDSATVRMTIDRGWRPSLRGVVCLKDGEGRVNRLAMQRDDDGMFQATIDAVTGDLTYWFEAGDDTTAGTMSVIRAVRRPEIVSATAVITPPPYARDRAPRTEDLMAGPVRAPQGGVATIKVRASKPVPPPSEKRPAGLRMADQEFVPFQVIPTDAQELLVSLPIENDLQFRVELEDEYGFENRGSPQHSILSQPDAPPTVSIIEPKSQVEITPNGSMPLTARVEDDFGVALVDMVMESAVGETAREALSDRLEPADSDDGTAWMVRLTWSAGASKLTAGDLLTCTISATDNRATANEGAQTTRSSPIHIRVISEAEFEVRLRDEVALLETRIRQAALEQAELSDRAGELLQRDVTPRELSAAEKQSAGALVQQQGRIARRVVELSKRFKELAERSQLNQPGNQDATAQLKSAGTALQRIGLEGMAATGQRLSEAREQTSAVDQQRAVSAGIESAESATVQLHALLRSLGKWGNFQGLVSKTRDVLDRQNALRERTEEFGEETLGRAVAELTETQAANLKRLHRQQEQLATDVEQLLERMQQVQEASEEKDPSSAEAVESALRAAAAQELSKREQAASEALAGNRTAAATIEQKAAADAMRRMVSALLERESRELAQLRKRIDRAAEQVAGLIEGQRDVRDATVGLGAGGGPDGAYDGLENEQRTLKRNAIVLVEELSETEQADAAARNVRQSVGPMGVAETRLRGRESGGAVEAQGEALALLEEAQRLLEELAAAAEREELRRSLAEIRESLQAIAAAQASVRKGIEDVRGAIEKQGKITRNESREITRLARDQGLARGMVDELRPELEQVVVYGWAMERVARWMELSRDRLDARRVDAELLQTNDRIIREVEKLLAAAAETESLPFDMEFAEIEQDDGTQPPGEPGSVVPTVAELLVLRAMQVDVHERTAALEADVGAGDAEESVLRRLKVVGEDQAELRRLTDLVTRRARQP